MRLFIAVSCKGETSAALVALRDRLRALAQRGNFSRTENLHLTLVFLGETPESQLPRIGALINAALDGRERGLCLNFCRTGCFRHSGKELWWLAPAPDDPGLPRLLALRSRLAAALEQAGIAFDGRPFSAHITLGREIRGTGGKAEALVPGIPVPIDRISLMKSEHRAGLLVYTELVGYDI
ncbi:MAG: RNA 2',3'-cyclic phosphodiesterase [Treponema sp.]|jgi:2'-5' RNA ligase|nr:RNA 2',3'-cyclic phosphodiesterase [Treponema sp.]